MKHELLKTLKKRERSLPKQLDEIHQEEQAIREKKRAVQTELNDTKRKIKILQQDRPHVSDHAVYRYLQRVQGLDTDKIREEMITPKALDLLDRMAWADGKYPAGNGYSLVVKDGTIVTIYI